MRFGVARRLGLDPGSLLVDDETPRFLWKDEARFKHLASEDDLEQAGIASFGRAVATALAPTIPPPEFRLAGLSAEELRVGLLAQGRRYVALDNLVAVSWAAGTAVVHLRVFPWVRKRMAAMTVRLGEQNFVLVAKDAVYPAWIAFYLAHELAHVALGHVAADEAVVDLDDNEPAAGDDKEEQAADEWALELLTGLPDIRVVSETGAASASELARVARSSGPRLGIEPGTLALCFAYSTGEWGLANAALRQIYRAAVPVWQQINRFALTQLRLDETAPDAADFLRDVLELDAVA